MSIRKVFYSILALAAAFAASGAVDPTNYTLNEPKIFTAAAVDGGWGLRGFAG